MSSAPTPTQLHLARPPSRQPSPIVASTAQAPGRARGRASITTTPAQWGGLLACAFHARFALLFALTVFVAGCAGSGVPASSEVPPTDPPTLVLEPCQLGPAAAECGTLQVYENRAAQSGPKIELRVGVIRAISTQPAPDPIFWLAGGPGGVATEAAGFALHLLGPALRERDLVFVDQRGIGGSNELTCPQPSDPLQQTDALNDCLAQLTADPSAYTTAWAMDDLDDVRAALGYDRINLYGESYGATAAQVYLLRHEAHVRTATLIGGSLLDVPLFERMPQSSQNALNLLLARCKVDQACYATFPELDQEVPALLAQLAQEPVTLPLVDPQTGRPLVFTREMASTGLHSLLVGTQTAVRLPHVVHLAYTGQWLEVAALSDVSGGDDAAPATWWLMPLTIICHEEWARLRPAETAAASVGSYLGYPDIRALTFPEAICDVMPRPVDAALYQPATRSNVPVLLINGEADPQDPPQNVAGTDRLYPNGLRLVAPGQAHGYTGVTCRAEIVADFVAQGAVDDLDTECLERVALPDFE